MAGLKVATKPLVSSTKPYPSDIGNAPRSLRATKFPFAEDVAQALEALQAHCTLNSRALRQSSPQVDQIVVTDATGKVIGAIGEFIFGGVATTNYFSEIHIGDPLNTGNPSQCLFEAAGGRVTIGQNGWLEVLDPYGADAAWIGAQFDTFAVTGAANNGSGLIRLTVAGHTLLTSDQARILNVGGVPNATGIWTVTKIDASHIDLQNSVWDGTYTSGGTVDRLLHVTGAASAAGLIRLTVVAHGYESGDTVNVASVGGVPNATGQWIISVYDVDHFDLVDSTWAGGYTSGGICLRYFAGVNAQTIAIGPDFPNYKLRAFADGSLKIKDATIILNGTGDTITLDPVIGQIIVRKTGVSPQPQVTISDGQVTLQNDDSSGGLITMTSAGFIAAIGSGAGAYINQTSILTGMIEMYADQVTTLALSELVKMYAYGGTFGPIVSCFHGGGTAGSPTATSLDDVLGGILMAGTNGTAFSPQGSGVYGVATEDYSGSAAGAKLVFNITPNGTNSAALGMTLDQDKVLDVVGGYKSNGTLGRTKTVYVAATSGGPVTTAITFTTGLMTTL